MIRRPPRPPLFPSTTLSRSHDGPIGQGQLHTERGGQAPADAAPADAEEALHIGAGEELLDAGSRRDRLGHDGDRKSTRLNSSHSQISYAVFCLKKKNDTENLLPPYHFPRLAPPRLRRACPAASLHPPARTEPRCLRRHQLPRTPDSASFPFHRR